MTQGSNPGLLHAGRFFTIELQELDKEEYKYSKYNKPLLRYLYCIEVFSLPYMKATLKIRIVQ